MPPSREVFPKFPQALVSLSVTYCILFFFMALWPPKIIYSFIQLFFLFSLSVLLNYGLHEERDFYLLCSLLHSQDWEQCLTQ